MGGAYYNEFDPFAAEWLSNLAAAGEITEGKVDERSIKEIRSSELMGYTRAHFFAGIGGWDLALRLAGWPIDREVWTGSCPCQPFSAAGKQLGEQDPRHLWPDFRELIRDRRPSTVFGEQVAAKDGRLWLAGVRSDLEGMGYSVGAADLCAAGIGAPHIRQRLYWVASLEFGKGGGKDHAGIGPYRMADAEDSDRRSGERGPETRTRTDEIGRRGSGLGRLDDGLADPQRDGLERPIDEITGEGTPGVGRRFTAVGKSSVNGLADANRNGLDIREDVPIRQRGPGENQADDARTPVGLGDAARGGLRVLGNAAFPRGSGHVNGPSWTEYEIKDCQDGKRRRIESHASPLAYGIPLDLGSRGSELRRMAKRARKNRVGRLKGYGNAIVPGLAAEFIKSFMEVSI